MRITDKKMMYAMLARGDFGHTWPSADTPEGAATLIGEHPNARWAFRMKRPGVPMLDGLSRAEALQGIKDLPPGSWNLSPMIRDAASVCYGHLYDSPAGLRLHYSTDKLLCRLNNSQDGCEQKWIDGSLAVRGYLRSVCDQRGYDTLDELLREYPSHVIEFTCVRTRADAYGPTNTVIWEVRDANGAEYEGSTWGIPRPVDWMAVDADRAALKEAIMRIEERHKGDQ